MQEVVNNGKGYQIILNGMNIRIENIDNNISINIKKIDDFDGVVSSIKPYKNVQFNEVKKTEFKSEHKVIDKFLRETIEYEYHMNVPLLKLYNIYIKYITDNKLKKYKMSLKKFKQELELAGITLKKNSLGAILVDVSLIYDEDDNNDDTTDDEIKKEDNEIKEFCTFLKSDDTALDKETVLEDIDIDEVLDKQVHEPIEEYNYSPRPELSNGFYSCG